MGGSVDQNTTSMQMSKYPNVHLKLCNHAGHQQLVNDVKFSPDARLVASASFDKSIRVSRKNLMDYLIDGGTSSFTQYSQRCGVGRLAGS